MRDQHPFPQPEKKGSTDRNAPNASQPEWFEEASALRDQLRRLESRLLAQNHAVNALKVRLAQQEAQLRAVSRLAGSIVNSRIWRSLVFLGGRALAGGVFLARFRSSLRRPALRAASEALQINCDLPRHDGELAFGKVLIQGWAVAESGIAKVEVVVGSAPAISAKTGLFRQDIGKLFPGFTDSEGAGFRVQVDLSNVPAGDHLLIIRTQSRQGMRAQCERIITVDPSAGPQILSVAEARAAINRMQSRPLFSFVVPVYNVAEIWLRRCLDSVLKQRYPHWELCIANDASSEPHIRPLLEEYRNKDKRIKVVHCEERGHISAASNAALSLAQGDFIALLDHDDEITEDALFEIARALDLDPSADMVYSDEDKIDEDNFCSDPFFKPDWSPEYFLTCMYTCHLGVYRTALVRECGGFRRDVTGAQDYDLALRIVSRTNRVIHVPKVLYHWRTLPQSTASGGDAKSYAYSAAQRALRSYLKETGIQAEVLPGPREGFHRILYEIRGEPRVSIVIPTAGRTAKLRGMKVNLVQNCVMSILGKSSWRNFEIIVIDNGDLDSEVSAFLDSSGISRLTYSAPTFNLAEKINLGCDLASGDHLVLLNDDVEVITPDWIENMLQYSQQPEIGAVGAKLLFPNGRIQHAGVVILGGCPGHPYHNHPEEEVGYYLSVQLPRNYLAVTGACMMTKTSLFREMKGFDPAFPLNYNDVDYCLRVHERGLRVVYTPYAELFHYESMSKEGPGSVNPEELSRFQSRWVEKYYLDPYYNPNLPLDYPYYRVE
jgi:GT2 family glycosyltransferase